MEDKNQRIATEIIELVGGRSNLKEVTSCMTRVRVTLYDDSKINQEKIKNIEGVLGLNKTQKQYQIVVGPGTANKVSVLINSENDQVKCVNETDMNDDTLNKEHINSSRYDLVVNILKRIANVFIPLIPAFAGCGMIMGIASLINGLDFIYQESIISAISIFPKVFFTYISIMIGINASKEFRGSTSIGGLLGGIVVFLNTTSFEVFNNIELSNGGVFATLIVTIMAAVLERYIRKIVPEALDMIITPMLTILISGVALITVVIPVSNVISHITTDGMLFLIDKGGVVVGGVLAGTFLPFVMTGLHHAITPVHVDMLAKTGVNTLLPILAMAGCGQVGASLAVLCKTKNTKLKKLIKKAIPIGILGIGETLIYSVTLPLKRPFIGACIGASVGGAIVSTCKVGAVSMGVSGFPLVALIQPSKIKFYIVALLSSYLVGFIATYILGFEDSIK